MLYKKKRQVCGRHQPERWPPIYIFSFWASPHSSALSTVSSDQNVKNTPFLRFSIIVVFPTILRLLHEGCFQGGREKDQDPDGKGSLRDQLPAKLLRIGLLLVLCLHHRIIREVRTRVRSLVIIHVDGIRLRNPFEFPPEGERQQKTKRTKYEVKFHPNFEDQRMVCEDCVECQMTISLPSFLKPQTVHAVQGQADPVEGRQS